MEWGSKVLFSHRNSRSAGVAILFNKLFNYNVSNVVTDNHGRIVICNINVENRVLTLANLYAPNNNPDILFHDFFEHLNCDSFVNNDIVAGGDFNVVLSNELDKSGGRSCHGNTRSSSVLKSYMLAMDLHDYLRIKYPEDKIFTRKQLQPLVFTRLDFFLNIWLYLAKCYR